MRLALCILGTEVLALHFDADTEGEDVEPGPPFGFSGGAGVQAERAEDWAPAEDVRSCGRTYVIQPGKATVNGRSWAL